MDDNDLPTKHIEKLTRRVPVEYILRRVPQEGLEEEPVDRIREAFDNNTQVHIRIIYSGKSNR